MNCTDNEFFYQESLQACEARIRELELRKSELQKELILQYSIDTGQTRTSVLRMQLAQVHRDLIEEFKMREDLRIRVGCGADSTILRPNF